MRWEDERYIRLYTRDTVEWRMLPWQSKALLPLILRKVDRAGLLELGKHGARGLASIVELPLEVVEPGLAGLLEDGCLLLRDTLIAVPNFIVAQEAPSSDALRAREYRARQRTEARDAVVTRSVVRDESSQNVTGASRNVTDRHDRHDARHSDPIPIRTNPNQPEEDLNHADLPAGDRDADLEAAYQAYPRKEGKSDGMKRLKAQVKTRADLEALKRAIANYVEQQRLDGNTQYLKHFSTFTSEWRDWVDWKPQAKARASPPARAGNAMRPTGDFEPGVKRWVGGKQVE